MIRAGAKEQYACLRAMTDPGPTLYKITKDKSEMSAASVVGGFSGLLTSDRAKNLDFFQGRRQTCWAHLDRHFKRMSERPGLSSQVGLDAMAVHDQVFHFWDQYKAEAIDADQLCRPQKPPDRTASDFRARDSMWPHENSEHLRQTCTKSITGFGSSPTLKV